MSVEDYYSSLFLFVMGNAVTGQYLVRVIESCPHKHTYMPRGNIKYLPMLMDSQSPCNSIEFFFHGLLNTSTANTTLEKNKRGHPMSAAVAALLPHLAKPAATHIPRLR